MKLICTIDTPEARRLAQAQAGTPVLLYHAKRAGVGSVGNPIRLDLRRWPDKVTQEALDLLSVALAVTAGDRLVRRDQTADKWTRDIDLVIPVSNPDRWTSIVPALLELLGFLTGDRWTLHFVGGGMTVHQLYDRRREWRRPARPAGDCVCLFSGGMDSFLGAAELVHKNRQPILVSHYQPGEQRLQGNLRETLGIRAANHFATNPNPVAVKGKLDTQQRARSFLFVALAAAIGSASIRLRSEDDRFDLFIPENGFIALNAPLSPARSSSCSTRTVHPRTVTWMRTILEQAGVPARLINPYAEETKGTITTRVVAAVPAVAARLSDTISCGAYRRNKYQQCGYCIPCLIRRAAFLAARQDDGTDYKVPSPAAAWRANPKWEQAEHLAAVEVALADEEAVLRRLRLTFKGVPLDQWATLEDVHTQGLHEVARVIQTL